MEGFLVESPFLQGEFLSPEQKILVKTAIDFLKAENKLKVLKFWGRISGITNDYYILQGFTSDYFRNIKYFYSHDLIEWVRMPRVEPEALRLLEACTSLFTGIPSHVFNFMSATDQKEVSLKEEDRLTAAVAVINNEMSIIPRSAFLIGSDNKTAKNKMFKGLSFDKLADHDSYVHFEDLRGSKVMFPLLDSRHTIKTDFPPAWRLQLEQEGQVAVVRSLLWPGLTFHHQVESPFYGWSYLGDGRRNWDICYMI
ncbi:radial spoke head protein 9 homolog [Neocloeon triangulifer]|uniref:radial spoke head protein 9 homolog n=1 Tax=Neocloeon triangulifer TaxID=2078957 RepID=UPI00286F6976|nr:radial spoke head protein 9 homolog [Neocloeon triangulifer]